MAAAEHGANFPMARKIRQSMTHKQMHDFASTPEKDLPERKKKSRHPLADYMLYSLSRCNRRNFYYRHTCRGS